MSVVPRLLPLYVGDRSYLSEVRAPEHVFVYQ